jgi:hypothetical protein
MAQSILGEAVFIQVAFDGLTTLCHLCSVIALEKADLNAGVPK